MKKVFLIVLVCGMCINSFGQPEISNRNITDTSEKWTITPVKNLKGELDQLDMNFPAGLDWNIGNLFITRQSDNKHITSFSGVALRTKKFYNIAPGEYLIYLNNLPIENVLIRKGHITRLKTGILKIEQEGRWEIYNESKEKYFTSYNKPLKFVVPVGSYQLYIGGQYYPVIIKEGKTLTDYTTDAQFNPEILLDDQFQYIMSPVADASDTTLATKGCLNFGLTSYDYFSPGEGYEFRPHIYNEAGAEMHTCTPGGTGFCTHKIYLAEGKYSVTATWDDPYGSIRIKSPIRILNVPVKKGYETRIKVGFLRNLTSGDFELLNETKELIHFQYMNRGTVKRPLPAGKYFVRQPGIGIFPIEIGDRKEYSLNTIHTSKNEIASFRISSITSNSIKTGMGRLNCDFPKADTVLFTLVIPGSNGSFVTISLDTVKFIDLFPGKYELKFGDMTLPFQIEKQKETKIIHGYIIIDGKLFCDPVKGGCFRNFDNVFKTIPVRPGYYYIHLGGSPNRRILIRISEGEVVDYRQSLLLF